MGELGTLTMILFVMLAVAPSAASAQDSADGPLACSQAAKFLKTTARASQKYPPGLVAQRMQASVRLLSCGALGGRTAAAMIREARTLMDTAALTATVGVFGNFRDSAVFNAAGEVAFDPAASEAARVYALRTLWLLRTGKYWLTYSRLMPADDYTTEQPFGRCERGYHVTDASPSWYDGAPLPAGYDRQIRRMAFRLERDRSQPVAVRAAASCVST